MTHKNFTSRGGISQSLACTVELQAGADTPYTRSRPAYFITYLEKLFASSIEKWQRILIAVDAAQCIATSHQTQGMIGLVVYQITDSQQITGQIERYLGILIPLAISFTFDEFDQQGNGSVIKCTNVCLQHKPSFLLVFERKRSQQFLRRHRIWFPGIDNVHDISTYLYVLKRHKSRRKIAY